MDKSIHVILGIDMETDCGHNTPFYEGVQKATPVLLDIFEKKGVKTTFYFTGDAARQNPASVELVRGCGHDIGCHSLYHETVGEELYPIPGVKPLLPGEVFHRLETATQWVEEVSGTRPVSFRGPRLWGSTEVVNALEKLGYTSDATYPMYYFRQRFTPYHPSSRDWTQKGELKLLEIPNFADMLMESRDQPTESDRDQWPIFRTEGADALMLRVKNFLRFLEPRGLPAVLCFYFHPWEFVQMQPAYHYGVSTVMPDPIIIEGRGVKSCHEFGLLIDRLKDMGAVFDTAAGLAEQWDRREAAEAGRTQR